MLVLSTRIVLDCFYLLILYSEKFSTDVCRLSYAVNVNLNLSKLIRKTKSSGNTAEASLEGIKIVVETFIFLFMQIL